jgi:hypothetical protein
MSSPAIFFEYFAENRYTRQVDGQTKLCWRIFRLDQKAEANKTQFEQNLSTLQNFTSILKYEVIQK